MDSTKTPTTNTPPAPLTVAFTSDYDVIGVVCEKGGIGKTSLVIRLMAAALLSGALVRAIEVDRQHRLGFLFGERITRIDLPHSEQVSENFAADTAALAPMFDAITAPKTDGLVFFDVGANLDERVCRALYESQVQDVVSSVGRRIALLVPLDGADDTITAAARTAQYYSSALPDADIIFVVPDAKFALNQALMTPEASKSYQEVILPLAGKRRFMVVERLKESSYQAFVALKVDPIRFMDVAPEEVGRAAAKGTGATTDSAHQWMGRRLKSDFEVNMGELAMEAGRVLGFRAGDPENLASEPAEQTE